MSLKSSTSNPPPKCDGTVGQYLLIIEPYVKQVAAELDFLSLITRREEAPEELKGINPDSGLPYTDAERLTWKKLKISAQL